MRVALVVLFFAGCAFSGDGDGGPMDAGRRDGSMKDAAVEDAGAGPRVEVGGGAFEFEALTEGQVVDFIAGPQGGGRFDGFHIWTGARIWRLEPSAISASFLILAASDRSELARLDWVTNFRPTSTDAYEIWGATPRLADCCAAVDQPLLMRVEVVDVEGISAAGEIAVRGAPECSDFTGNFCP